LSTTRPSSLAPFPKPKHASSQASQWSAFHPIYYTNHRIQRTNSGRQRNSNASVRLKTKWPFAYFGWQVLNTLRRRETNTNEQENHEETIHPCNIDAEGFWKATTGHREPVIGQQFDTPEGTEWRTEEIRFISAAHEHIDECESCEAGVPVSAIMLEGVAHQIYPCCSCGLFVWLERPQVPSEIVEEYT